MLPFTIASSDAFLPPPPPALDERSAEPAEVAAANKPLRAPRGTGAPGA